MCMQAAAQKLLWDITLNTRFDNREYNDALERSQTLFSTKFAPELGIMWGGGDYIKAGTDLFIDFGAPDGGIDRNPALTLYYGYESRRFNAFAGVLPRGKVMGCYSNAFFSDSVRFYDSQIEGVLLQYKGLRGFAELGCDWSGMETSSTREKFMIFASGQANIRSIGLGFNASMFHYAQTSSHQDGVVDNVLLNPYISVDLRKLLPMDILYLRAGWLQAFQNDRTNVGEYVYPHGALIEMGAEKRGVGIYSATYLGGDLMPYYSRFGTDLYRGEQFFHTDDDIYERLEVYWELLRRRDMKLHLAAVQHYDGRDWNWQQVVRFTVYLDEKMFQKYRFRR